VAVVEVPLLFEAGIEGAFDATVALVADEGVRRRRAGGREHKAVTGRAARQLPQDEKARRADYVVRNDGTLSDLEEAMRHVLDALRRKAAR
jgi:dephospho-CoA kinase